MKPRDVVQFSAGKMKGMFAQVISADGKCLSRDMDGTTHQFELHPDEQFILIGVAALGPRAEQAASLSAPAPAALPPINPEELLQPLPPTVKATPMNEPRPPPPPKKIRPIKPPPAPYTGPKVPYVFTVTNALDEKTEVEIQVRADKKPNRYNGRAIMDALNDIKPIKPYRVEHRAK